MKTTIHHSIEGIGARAWNALTDRDHPFHSYEFLHGLETSGCLGGESGWEPIYLAAWNESALVGITWLYLKSHSYGEYIFDWSWAEAWHRMGIPYYPKLVGAVPFTPVGCPKLLVEKSADSASVVAALLEVASQVVSDVSGIHWLFVVEEEIAAFQAANYLIRDSVQFHWHNREYETFDDFASVLKAKRRRDIRRERRLAAESGLRFETVTGDQLNEGYADTFYQFYQSTIQRKYAEAYLNLAFFRQLFRSMPERVVLQLAYDDTQCIAGALFLRGERTLFGRYWGCSRQVPFLHFELCMYRGIDFAIKHKLARFEAGAQGPHKIARGFNPVRTKSAHLITQPQLHAAVGNFLEEESKDLNDQLENISLAYR